MAIKKFKPTTPSRRFMTVSTFDEVTTTTPERSLLVSKNKSGGRNANGRITVRHIGGGNRVKYRIIDFKRDKDGIPAKVATIEYDPNRSANIALLNYADGEKRYIIAPLGITVGDVVVSGPDADIKAGNCLPIETFPSVPLSIISSLTPVAAHNFAEQPATKRNLWQKKASTQPYVFPAAK